jgi:predicted metal-dependent hydrolase
MPDGVARVTIPRGGSMEFALEFVKRNRTWLEREISRHPRGWADGTTILLRGIPSEIQVIVEGEIRRVALGALQFRFPLEGDLRAGIENGLRQLATEELIPRTAELARLHNVEIQSVQVRAQRSRWGSCSRAGRISLNWRLIQTPEFARDYIIVHELMHRREMNHSSRFWAHVQNAFPDYIKAERWLRKNASLLT